jgi:hypothetical protein
VILCDNKTSKNNLFNKDNYYSEFKYFNGFQYLTKEHRKIFEKYIVINKEILKKAEDTRNEYGKYIKDVIGNSKNVAMIDSGYQGTTQLNIEKTYNLKFKGRYIIYKGNKLLEDVKGLYDFKKYKLKENLIFLESVFIDTVGSYSDITNGKFKNEDINITQNYFEDKIKIVEGIKSFVLDMLKFNIDMNTVSYEKPAYIFYLMCSKDFVKNDVLFESFYHDNLYVREGVKQIHRQ